KFSTSEGRALCRRIICARVPFDPHDYQLDGITHALDKTDLLAITPTGSGKTGFLTMYLLVMQAVMRRPSLCPQPPPEHFRRRAAMVVVCPTMALQGDMVPKFSAVGLRPLVINKNTLDEGLRSKNSNLWSAASDYDALIIAPEQLTSKGFENLLKVPSYQSRVVAIGVDEAHLLNTWGKTFRQDFQHIGPLRARFNHSPVLIALTATLRGASVTDRREASPFRSVCNSLGLHEGYFHVLRRSNARHDLQFDLRMMKSSASSTSFPELDWVLAAPRNILIFCRTIKFTHQIQSYLTSKLSSGQASSATQSERVRSYHSLNWESYNTATLARLRSSQGHLVVLATDALSIGIDVREVDDVIIFEGALPDDLESLLQKAGRVRDGREKGSRLIVYLPQN
ncbi:P-loop containing nucleoside triphosphate hydrolase protein, partial [Epithele typhae]|uniref:P-loop containing nucleoside triphosphate hydrolase protein n=1 Tax=Epithele typhae TaxID=378194 RepID=UPI0020082CB2